MPPRKQFSRINTLELKAQIEKRIGHERAQRYYALLCRHFYGGRPNKVEFDKLVKPIIGTENIGLHNMLFQSVLKNASLSNVPPPPALQATSKLVKAIRRKPISNSPCIGSEDGSLHKSPSPSSILTPLPLPPAPAPASASASTAWANGDAFPLSPRKGRSSTRDRKGRDRPSPLGPHGKTDPSASLGAVGNEVAAKASENGDVNSCDLHRPMHRSSGAAEQPEAEVNNHILPPSKRQRIKGTILQEQTSVDSKPVIEVVTVEDGEEVEQVDDDQSTIWVESPLRAPLGVPFFPGSVGAARRAPQNSSISYLISASSNQHERFDSTEQLPDTETLQRQMEQNAASEGLQGGVSYDAAKLLNHAVNTKLMNLIKSAIDLQQARCCHEQDRLVLSKQTSCKLEPRENGVCSGPSTQVQRTGTLMETAQKARSRSPISLLDFKLAMDLNPQQLGEDWPVQLEKICFCLSEEE